MLEYLTASTLPAPRFRYTPCVKSGPFYTVAGMIALDPATGALAPGGPEGETRQILKNLVAALPEWGLGLDDMVSARIFTTRFDQFPVINKAWEEVFNPPRKPPARTSAGVSALPLNATVEIEFVLYREGQ